MIKHDKNDERVCILFDIQRRHLTRQGYLRCGKVLIQDGKPDKALDVYAYGLKTLSSKHPRRQVSDPMLLA